MTTYTHTPASERARGIALDAVTYLRGVKFEFVPLVATDGDRYTGARLALPNGYDVEVTQWEADGPLNVKVLNPIGGQVETALFNTHVAPKAISAFVAALVRTIEDRYYTPEVPA